MTTARTILAAAVAVAAALAVAAAPRANAKDCAAPAAAPPPVDIAICLDTSGSMSGLIESAKQKLWAIVNELASAQPTPKLRVALVTYGNNGHDPENGWVRIESGFTDDLDLISGKLFALRTNGGTEYVGRVLQFSDQLDWHASGDGIKLVVVAGNESADQDRQVPFAQMCRTLVSRGIMVNAIYCGAPTDQLVPGWQEVARLADGTFAAIDQDNGTIVIATPFDEDLAELSTALNATYIPFGAGGTAGAANQAAQDANAESLNAAAAASRAQTKAQGLYQCSWDLVDACNAGSVKIQQVRADDLPENMRTMTVDQRQSYLEAMKRQRAETSRKIEAISAQRDAFIQQEIARRSVDDSGAFDTAIRKAIRKQAAARGFTFPAKDDGC